MAEATLLVLLFRRKLAGLYRWFVTFLVVEWVQMATLLSLDPNSGIYAKCWALSEIALLVSLAFATIEVTRKILEHYPRVRELASGSFGMIFSLGAVASTVLLLPFMEESRWQQAETYFVLKVLRWESVTLFAFLAAQVLWFVVFPIRMRRNVFLHRWLLAFYGGAVPGSGVFLYDLFEYNQKARTWINLSMMTLQICLMIAWCCYFTEAGEKAMVGATPRTEIDLPSVGSEQAWDVPIAAAREVLNQTTTQGFGGRG